MDLSIYLSIDIYIYIYMCVCVCVCMCVLLHFATVDRPTSEQCSVTTNPIQDLNQRSGAWVNIFLDLPFGCDGLVESYEFQAQGAGTFYPSAWRNVGGDSYELIGFNTVRVNSAGKHVSTL